jgi:hypothetical protein
MHWTVVVADEDHWTPEHRAACTAGPGDSYDEWVTDQLRDAMSAAGERWIADHPDLFRGSLI